MRKTELGRDYIFGIIVYFQWLRGPTAYNVASSFCWKESAVNSRVIRLRRLCGGGVCP